MQKIQSQLIAKLLAVYFFKCFQIVRLHSHFYVELQSAYLACVEFTRINFT